MLVQIRQFKHARRSRAEAGQCPTARLWLFLQMSRRSAYGLGLLPESIMTRNHLLVLFDQTYPCRLCCLRSSPVAREPYGMQTFTRAFQPDIPESLVVPRTFACCLLTSWHADMGSCPSARHTRVACGAAGLCMLPANFMECKGNDEQLAEAMISIWNINEHG